MKNHDPIQNPQANDVLELTRLGKTTTIRVVRSDPTGLVYIQDNEPSTRTMSAKDWSTQRNNLSVIESNPAVRKIGLQLNKPNWYKRQDFIEFLNRNRHAKPGEGAPVASWHRGGKPTEMSDVFMTFDRDSKSGSHWEGSDSQELPEDIALEIGLILEQENLSHGVLWITNLD